MTIRYPFDRPVIIVAAPRSGSTLLFDSLSKSSDLWTIGGESHGLFESIHRFNPTMGFCDSNALYAKDAPSAVIAQIRSWFFQLLRDAQGRSFHDVHSAMTFLPRLLEKTPKNCLRISLLNALFPDALFVYLYRNPRENISSIMDAWVSGRFVTYKSLPGRDGSWSLLLPPGWQAHNDSSLEQIAAFQWESSNRLILQELKKLDRSRWMVVSHGQQVGDTFDTIRRICRFCDVSPDSILQSMSSGYTRLSRYTLTAPAKNKWHKNAIALSKVLPGLQETIDCIRENADGLPDEDFDLSIDPAVLEAAPHDQGDPDIGAAPDTHNGK